MDKENSQVFGTGGDSGDAVHESTAAPERARRSGDNKTPRAAAAPVVAAATTLQSVGTTPNLVRSLTTTTMTSSSSLATHLPRVLRAGETLASFFLLGSDHPRDDDHTGLCHQIANGVVNDAPSWLQVVERAHRVVEQDAARGPDYLRLLRRATSRIPLSADTDSSSAASCASKAQLWLRFARAQQQYGTLRDARLTLHHMQHQGHVSGPHALQLAHVERLLGHTAAARATLQHALQAGLAPRPDLQRALQQLDGDGLFSRKMNAPTAMLMKASPKRPRLEERDATGSSSVSVLNDSSSQMSIDESMSATLPDENDTQGTLNKDSETAQITSLSLKFQLAPLNRSKLPTSPPPGISNSPRGGATATTQSAPRSPFALPALREKVDKGAAKADKAETGKAGGSFDVIGITTKKPASSTAFQLGRNHNGIDAGNYRRPPLSMRSTVSKLGGPKRVDPWHMNVLDSEDETDSDTVRPNDAADDCMDVTTSTVAKTPQLKAFKKADISYMLQWEPDKFRSGRPSSSSVSNETVKDVRVGFAATPSLPKIDENSCSATPSESAASSQAPIIQTSTTSTSTQQTASSTSTHRTHDSAAATSTPNVTETLTTTPATPAIPVNLHPDFLKLVSNDNMLHVNDKPYAKLGVVGKGGSCKVYRTLSNDFSVVAIKKVKIAGMDKKAIDGYANEIALLKRLQGNSSIINLHDSQVDYERKCIFLVMELGEVDLNHVLQQQAQTNSGRRRLNMNFIRLTWHQMLSAVHSIHEERIIHSDLKPANFLFVRGALKLIDFGIAKAIQSDDTTNVYRDAQVGTLNYMSPEAILDSGSGTGSHGSGMRMRLGRPSDVWSLGCILYQMVYGQTPFADLHVLQKLQAIVNPKHEIKYPDADEYADAVDAISQCLRRDPAQRPPIVGPGGLLNEHVFLHSHGKKAT